MPRPRICVAVQAVTTKHAVSVVRGLAAKAPDLIEIRFDYSQGRIDPWQIRRATEASLIATYRANGQRACSIASEKDRIGVILEACEAGFQRVDADLSTPNLKELAEQVHDRGSDLMVSHHDHQGTPSMEVMEEALNLTRAVGGDICKVVGTANAYEDNLAYLDFVRKNPGTVCFGMGQIGVPSRILSPLFGGAFTYASAVKGDETAPGQLTIEEMREVYTLMGVGE